MEFSISLAITLSQIIKPARVGINPPLLCPVGFEPSFQKFLNSWRCLRIAPAYPYDFAQLSGITDTKGRRS